MATHWCSTVGRGKRGGGDSGILGVAPWLKDEPARRGNFHHWLLGPRACEPSHSASCFSTRREKVSKPPLQFVESMGLFSY